jgi:hypothetical protein
MRRTAQRPADTSPPAWSLGRLALHHGLSSLTDRRAESGTPRRPTKRPNQAARNVFHTSIHPLGGRPGLTSSDRPGPRLESCRTDLGGRRARLTRALSAPPNARNPCVQAKPWARGHGYGALSEPPQQAAIPVFKPNPGQGRQFPFRVTDVMLSSPPHTHPPRGPARPDPESRRPRPPPARSLGGRRARLTRPRSVPSLPSEPSVQADLRAGGTGIDPYPCPRRGRNPCVQARSSQGTANLFWARVTHVLPH